MNGFTPQLKATSYLKAMCACVVQLRGCRRLRRKLRLLFVLLDYFLLFTREQVEVSQPTWTAFGQVQQSTLHLLALWHWQACVC
jgi:hypothetical protein